MPLAATFAMQLLPPVAATYSGLLLPPVLAALGLHFPVPALPTLPPAEALALHEDLSAAQIKLMGMLIAVRALSKVPHPPPACSRALRHQQA